MQRYISIDNDTNDTSMEVHLLGKNNQICGNIKSLNPQTNTLENVRDIFILKNALSGLSTINVNSEDGFTIEQLAQKVNELINLLKGANQ